ncbi:MAG TPA: hypothetical protein VF796_01200, partial [Humisphaera sp.]
VANVGTGLEHSAAEIVETIGRLLGRAIEIEVDAERVRATDKLHQIADAGRLRALVGGCPTMPLDEGLRRLLAHEGLLTG